MKVMLFTINFAGGGGERATVLLANGLKAQGHSVELLTISEAGPNRMLLDDRIPVRRLGPSRAYRSLPWLVAVLRKSKPDILVTSMVIANVLGGMAKMVLRTIKVVAVEHSNMNEVYHIDKSHIAAQIGYNIAPFVYDKLDLIVCVDKSAALSVAAFTHRTNLRLKVLPNPVILPDANERMQKDPGHPWLSQKESPVFINVGRLSRQKNQKLLLRAFARVVAHRPAKLIILGEGELRGDLLAEVKALGLEGKVDLPGFQNPYPYLARSDAFVLTSSWEALPTVLVEALYCGTQIVSTKASLGTVEIIGYGKFGRIVKDFEPDNVAHDMILALDQPIDRSALQRQASLYSIEIVSQLYADEFRKLLYPPQPSTQ